MRMVFNIIMLERCKIQEEDMWVLYVCELLYANKLLLSRELEFEWFNGVCGVCLILFYVEDKQVIGGLVETII